MIEKVVGFILAPLVIGAAVVYGSTHPNKMGDLMSMSTIPMLSFSATPLTPLTPSTSESFGLLDAIKSRFQSINAKWNPFSEDYKTNDRRLDGVRKFLLVAAYAVNMTYEMPYEMKKKLIKIELTDEGSAETVLSHLHKVLGEEWSKKIVSKANTPLLVTNTPNPIAGYRLVCRLYDSEFEIGNEENEDPDPDITVVKGVQSVLEEAPTESPSNIYMYCINEVYDFIDWQSYFQFAETNKTFNGFTEKKDAFSGDRKQVTTNMMGGGGSRSNQSRSDQSRSEQSRSDSRSNQSRSDSRSNQSRSNRRSNHSRIDHSRSNHDALTLDVAYSYVPLYIIKVSRIALYLHLANDQPMGPFSWRWLLADVVFTLIIHALLVGAGAMSWAPGDVLTDASFGMIVVTCATLIMNMSQSDAVLDDVYAGVRIDRIVANAVPWIMLVPVTAPIR